MTLTAEQTHAIEQDVTLIDIARATRASAYWNRVLSRFHALHDGSSEDVRLMARKAAESATYLASLEQQRSTAAVRKGMELGIDPHRINEVHMRSTLGGQDDATSMVDREIIRAIRDART